MSKLILIFFVAAAGRLVGAFVIPNSRQVSSARMSTPFKHKMMIHDTSSFLTAVEVFDGSAIVDPVVVSGVFWTSLKSKLLAVVIGQILATVAFALLANLLASQIGQLGDFVSKRVFSSSASSSPPSQKTFTKATDISNKPAPDFGKLLICLAIDVIGSSSELVPILGELTDVIYAPIAATLLRNLFGGSNIIFALEFAEEILPFTDILPLATICWVVDTFFADSDLARVLQLGNYGWATDAIDTKSETTQTRLPGSKDND